MFNKLLDKPYRILSIIGFFFTLALVIMNFVSDFFYSQAVYPYAGIVVLATEILVLALSVLSFFFYTRHYIYFMGIELLVFSCLYVGSIYLALFLSSILLVLILADRKSASTVQIIIYAAVEVLKAAMVLPYGNTTLFYYLALDLFALSTIGCINLLFRHAYEKKDTVEFRLEDLKLTDRQIDCIKEIVLNNTTIKELAMNHNISESAIKKDLAQIYHVLKITGKADLKALFIDYKF